MSIASGRLKGRRLRVPPGVRPSGGRLKAALFSIWGERLVGATVLDLYAGSGGVGLEAWSRGAAAVTFVECGRRALAALERNLDLVPESEACSVVPLPVARALERLRREERRFGLLFADPPYDLEIRSAELAALAAVASEEAELAIEHRASNGPPTATTAWRLVETRSYGDSALSRYARSGGASADSSSR